MANLSAILFLKNKNETAMPALNLIKSFILIKNKMLYGKDVFPGKS